MMAGLFGGSDPFSAGSAAMQIYGVASGVNISLTGTAAGATVVDYVGAETVDATNAGGHDQIFVGQFATDASIIGSNAGSDQFWVLAQDSTAAARTVTLANWQSSDAVTLYGYSDADQSKLGSAIATGAAQVTLSDKTTINFINKTV
jgi:hypothetical protein